MIDNFHHHSASSVNGFIENRFTWYLKKVRGMKIPGNPAMCRGTAVEAGINHYITDPEGNIDKACEVAIKSFKEETAAMLVMPEMRTSIPLCVKEGIKSVMENYGSEGCSLQEKVEINLPGLQYPTLGYLDWRWKNKKLVVDNKVTGKKPSELKQSYKVQGALYKHATGDAVQFHFIICSEKNVVKTHIIPITEADYSYGMRLYTLAAKAVEIVLDMHLTFEEVNALWFGDPSKSWNEDEARIVMRELGFK
jgi:hypothetical protein